MKEQILILLLLIPFQSLVLFQETLRGKFSVGLTLGYGLPAMDDLNNGIEKVNREIDAEQGFNVTSIEEI